MEQIETAYNQIIDELSTMKNNFMEDMEMNPEMFQGLTVGDALIWFIEGLSQ